MIAGASFQGGHLSGITTSPRKPQPKPKGWKPQSQQGIIKHPLQVTKHKPNPAEAPMFPRPLLLLLGIFSTLPLPAQNHGDPFAQITPLLPAPTPARTASGAPGPGYWQQRADYRISVKLDETTRSISGEETITYSNHSPHVLKYLWLELEQNSFRPDAARAMTQTTPPVGQKLALADLKAALNWANPSGGMHIDKLQDQQGKPMPYTIAGTRMQIGRAHV